MALLLLSSCIDTRRFPPKTYLLHKQTITSDGKFDQQTLDNLTVQKPNRIVAFTKPYLYMYQLGSKYFNKDKAQAKLALTESNFNKAIAALPDNSRSQEKLINKKQKTLDKLTSRVQNGNWLMRVIGEPPVYEDSIATDETLRELRAYIKNRGYWHGAVILKRDTLKARMLIKLKFKVNAGIPVTIGTIRYITSDVLLQHLIDSTSNEAYLKTGENWDRDKQGQERERLDKLFRNHGFFAFNRNFISLDNDTAKLGLTNTVDIALFIEQPRKGPHKQYSITDVTFNLQEAEGNAPLRDTAYYKNIIYYSAKKFGSFRTLDNRLYLHPKQLYSQDKVTRGQAALSSMDMFKFINYNIDTSGHFGITWNATKLDRFEYSNELGLIVSAGAPGPFANLGFKVRNIFGGFEIFEVNGRYSQEGQYSAFSTQSQVFRTREIGVNASITIPKILPTGLRDYLFNDYNPRTRFLIGFTSVTRPEYRRDITKASLNYTLQPNNKSTIGLSPIDITVNFTQNLNPTFDAFLQQLRQNGNNLYLSFRNSLVTAITGYYMLNTIQAGTHKRSYYFRVSAEAGGGIPSLVNQVYYANLAGSSKDSLFGLQLFRFARLVAEGRYYYPLGRNTMLAMRANAGIAKRLGSKALPYEKYFFSGGSNSIRAWAPRRLGPGGYTPVTQSDGSFDYRFEQPGEIQLEANIEIRRKLIGFVDGALFVDAGNVWLASADLSHLKGEFDINTFYTQIAVGVGYGIRFDFKFLVVRFDFGVKAYDPAQLAGQRWRLNKLSLSQPFGERNQTVINVGIGYPF